MYHNQLALFLIISNNLNEDLMGMLISQDLQDQEDHKDTV